MSKTGGRKAGEALCLIAIGAIMVAVSVFAADDGPWPWSGTFGKETTTLLLLGDFNVQQRPNPADALEHVRETLNQADMVYANLEGLLVKSAGPAWDLPDKTGWTHLGPEAVLALKAGNVGGVGVANNVAYGHENILNSLSVLDQNGIAHAGGGANLEQAHEPAVVERSGVKFGFLQYTSKWYEEANQIATPTSAGVARLLSRDGLTVEPADLQKMRLDIQRLRPRVDILVVSAHTRDGQGRSGGASSTAASRSVATSEPDYYSELPVNPLLAQAEAYQKELAHAAIDEGADIVYGHGCHMLQRVELYQGKPILYCLGNFASDWIRVRKYKEGMVARVVVSEKKVRRVSLVPVTRDEDTNNVRMLDPTSGEGAVLIQKVIQLSGGIPLKIDGLEAVLVDP